MALNPIDYRGMIGTDARLANKANFGAQIGLQAGQAFNQSYQAAKAKRDKEKALEAQQQAQAERQQAMMEQFRVLEASNYDPAKTREILVAFPELAQTAKMGFQMKTDEDRKQINQIALQGRSFIKNGDQEGAANHFEEKAKYFEKSDPQKADALKRGAESIRKAPTPEAASAIIDITAGGVLGDDYWDVLEKSGSIKKTAVETEDISLKRNQDFKEKMLKLGIEQTKLDELPSEVRKSISDLTDKSNALDIERQEAEKLLESVGVAKETWGKPSLFFGAVRTFFGNRDSLDKFRTKANRMVAQRLVQELPQGAASENDVKLIREGFPAKEAGAEEWAEWLEALSRLSQAKVKANDARIEWLSENRNEGKAKKSFKVGGRTVEKGETYRQFMKRTRGDIYNDPQPSEEVEVEAVEMTPELRAEAQGFFK